MFSPIVSLPLTQVFGSGQKALYCAASFSVWARNFSFVVARPPVADPAGFVELAAVIVEAVAHLVADDRADGAVVHRRIGVRVEERRLQDGGGEGDLVERRAVVGVDRLRVHPPLGAIDRLAEARDRRRHSNATAGRGRSRTACPCPR